MIYNPTPKRGFILRFAEVVKCAANHAMTMGLGCTADFQTINHPNCSFSFSLLSKSYDYRQSSMLSPGNRCGVLSFKQRSHRSLRNAKFVVSSSQRYDCPRKDFDASWGQFRVFVGAYVLARPSFHTCIATFQTYGTLGLPMCHVFTVSGSSLPVPIFIGRRFDQIILQAEVMESGMKVFPHMVGDEWQQ